MTLVSPDIIACLAQRTMIGVILEHHDDGTVTSPDCPLEKCSYFTQCDISKNNFVKKSIAAKGK